MIQLTTEQPEVLAGDLSILEREWQRFADGIVNFQDLNSALRAQFGCSAATEVEDLSEDEAKLYPMARLIPTGPGKLYFFAKNMIWAQENGTYWSVDYRDILLHASCAKSFDLHIQLSTVLEGEQEIIFEGGEDECFPFLAVSFSFSDSEQVDEAFVALSECAALHPDSSSDSEQDEDDEEDEDCEAEADDDDEEEEDEQDESASDSKKAKIEQYDDEARDLLR